ncbi:MAG: hypothetical protein OXH16_02430 [Gemmatimonadetes bacterium]|nr:hypothetical protein [Gemmatimonadota bacterium]
MAEFDTISKHLIQKYPDDFASFTLGSEDIEVLAVIDTGQYTVEARQTDSLIRVRMGDEEVLVHNEFQTTDSTNPPMPRRMAGYIGRAIEHHGLPIYSNVIYLRPNAGQRDLGYYVQEHLDYEITIRYRVIRLIEIEGERVLESGQSGLIPFTPLMKPPEGMASDVWLHQCIHTARTRLIARSSRADYLAGMVALSELVYESEVISAIILQEGIMDLIRESSLFQSLTQESREEAREEGFEQGREEGVEQGIEQGGRERAIEDILDVLEIRFDLHQTDPLSARISAIEDLQRLKQLHRAAIQVSNLDEFERMLDSTT